MKIVDSQVHIWYPNTSERPWQPAMETKPHRDRPFFMAEDLLAEMRAAGIERAIIAPPAWEGYLNDRAISAVQLYPDRFAIMGRFRLDATDTRRMVETWKQQTGMLGVRLTFINGRERQWLTDGTADSFWPLAEKWGLGVMINVPGNLPAVKKIAERYPGLKLLIDHMGIPGGMKDDAVFPHIEELCRIAPFQNVGVKIVALPCYSNESYPHPKLHQYVKRVYDAFGPKRLFWASDLTRLPCSYSLCKMVMTEEMKWLSATDLEWIMGRAVCEWLGWPL